MRFEYLREWHNSLVVCCVFYRGFEAYLLHVIMPPGNPGECRKWPLISLFVMVQEEVTAEVNVLLSLKKKYKELTGEDYMPAAQQTKKPDTAGKAKQTAVTSAPDAAGVKVVKDEIETQGQKVREMKASGATKVM